MKNLLLMFTLTCLFIACGHKKNAKDFMGVLEAETGNDYSIAKLHTAVGKYVVFKNNTTGKYEAYNLSKWDRKEDHSYQDFLDNGAVKGVDMVFNLDKQTELVSDGYWADEYETVYEYYEYHDEDCDCWVEGYDTRQVWVGSYWVDTSYYVDYYYGGGFKFSKTAGASKDLELMASLKEEAQLGFVTYKLKNDYKLSESRSLELAKLASKYQKLESKRALTKDEKNIFAKKALGISLSDVESALKDKAEGNENKMNSLLKEAAKVNDTSVENIEKFVSDFAQEAI